MLIVRAPILRRFPHGFTTRQGGVSPAPWDVLNLGGAVGDAPERVQENWRRLEVETGLGFARVRQVHGARAVRADAAGAPADEADVVVSLRPGLAACVSVADCVPVLLADPESGAVAAVHAGWRGTIARAAAEGVRALGREAGAAPRLDLWAANRRVLEAAGLHPDRIELLGRCTACERELFFSHRRDAGRTGRQVAFIAPPPPTPTARAP